MQKAEIYGGQMALKLTATVPAMMAVGYLILVLYFRAKGGYQVEVLHGAKPEGEHYTGGVEGPGEAMIASVPVHAVFSFPRSAWERCFSTFCVEGQTCEPAPAENWT